MHEIPCKNCPKLNIGETDRLLSTRLTEHKSEQLVAHLSHDLKEKLQPQILSNYKSPIVEHIATNNHAIGWEEANVKDDIDGLHDPEFHQYRP